jgi:hypothetical protein
MKYIYPALLLSTALFSNFAWSAENSPYTPEKILPSGVDESISVNPYTGESGSARKGTVAATLNNVALLNKLLLQPASAQNDRNIKQIIQAIESLLPSLKVVGMFHFFSIEEWLSDDKRQPGRTLVGVLYLQKYPKELNADVKKTLARIHKESSIKVLNEHIEKLL